MNKKILNLVLTLSLTLTIAWYVNTRDQGNRDSDIRQTRISTKEDTEKIEGLLTEERTNPPLTQQEEKPKRLLLDVPFLVQAPFGNWDELHENACEEAALLMVKYFRDSKKITDDKEADNELIKLVNFGQKMEQHTSITLVELKQLAEEYYQMNSGRIENEITPEKLKQELIMGKPIIIPADGKKLKNPYFRGDGPYYHMLVITGYDEADFITNDPGTKRGQNYRYRKEHLISTIFDYDKNDMSKGQKSYLVFD